MTYAADETMGGVSTTTRQPTVDPSAALVDRIASEALNPGYARRAESRASSGGRSRRRGSTALTLVMLALVGLLVSVLLVAARQNVATIDSERSSLLALAEQAQAEVTALAERAAALDAEVTALRAQALGSEAVGRDQAELIESRGIAAGTLPVTGPGARVVVDDAAEALDGDPSLSRVLDLDLQQVVNGLWESGAEAVAVNGQRVGALTAIRSAQDVILVNYSAVVAPYEVSAIGDPRRLPTDFLRSSGGQWLQAVNLSADITFTIDSVTDDIEMPGEAAGVLRHAAPVTGDQEGAP